MAKRKIIKIDESRCTGCGECITTCAEGAIELKGGKAKVVSDSFCDGLGACLAVCPAGALTIEEREAEEFDEAAVKQHQRRKEIAVSPCTAPVSLKPEAGPAAKEGKPETGAAAAEKMGTETSQLSSWPIQMRLVPTTAPYLKGARLLIAADCTGFACPSIQEEFLKGRIALIGCPKLDDRKQFVDKLSEIIRANEIKDITTLHMEVPCCSNLRTLVSEAVRLSGKSLPVKHFVAAIRGGVSC